MEHDHKNRKSPLISRRQIAVSASVVILLLTLVAGQAHAHVALDYPNGGEVLEVGSVVQISWSDVVDHGAADFNLSYSISGPAGPWISIAGGLPRTASVPMTYDWLVPDTPSSQVRVRVVQDNVTEMDYDAISNSDVAIVDPAMILPVVVEPERDATIHEDGDGTLANGSGSFLFTGRTEAQNDSAERRALLAFPIADVVPEGSTVASVSLELTVSKTRSGAQTVGLHRLIEDWSEGPSIPSGQEGGGATASAGDVTWIHREFPDTLWTGPGGYFLQVASATAQIAGLGGYTFSNTPELVADVQGWLDDPSSNFGWILVVDTPPTGSAKRFNSRENDTATSRPKLTINYVGEAQEPIASFSYTPTQPEPGEEIQFTDESTGEPTSWLWDFGDSQTSDEQHPSHSYATSGSRTVTLVVSNASGSDTAVEEVRVGSPVRRPSRRVAPIDKK